MSSRNAPPQKPFVGRSLKRLCSRQGRVGWETSLPESYFWLQTLTAGGSRDCHKVMRRPIWPNEVHERPKSTIKSSMSCPITLWNILFAEKLLPNVACSKHLNSRARSSDGGERGKTYAGKTRRKNDEGRLWTPGTGYSKKKLTRHDTRTTECKNHTHTQKTMKNS